MEVIKDIHGVPQWYKFHIEETRNVYITSDHHFGHENIIKFQNRPFQDVRAMDDALRNNWNASVKETDIVFHLGDFTLGNYETYFRYRDQLKGAIYHLGQSYHHDKRWINDEAILHDPALCFTHVISPLVRIDISYQGDYSRTEDRTIVLCHYPMRSWDKSFHGSLCFHGHTHGDTFHKVNLVNVCVEWTHYTPMNLYDFLE